MTPEQLLKSVHSIFERFKQQGVEVVYGVKAEGRYYLGTVEAKRIRGSSATPVNYELRTADDVNTWMAT